MIYAPNITRRSRETGIGNWTDADFLRAVHDGVRKDGQHLYPAFPYESYTQLADRDVLAIKAYLFSQPTAHAVTPANRLGFPFDQRWLMGLWSAVYNPDQRFQPHDDRSPAWNRGAYVAEALAHCGDCHTPRNLAQALDNRRKFGGTLTQGWRAYNITGDATSGLGGWSDAELARVPPRRSRGRARGRGWAYGRGGGRLSEPAVALRHPVGRDLPAQHSWPALERAAGARGPTHCQRRCPS